MCYRNRIALASMGGFLALFVATIAVIGAHKLSPAFLAVGMLGVVLSYLLLLAIFIYQDADVGTASSAYPSHMFTLPVRTSKLVFVPMMLGTAVTFGVSFLLVVSVRHGGAEIALFWPATLIATILALLQAIFWSSWGVPYAKLLLTLISLPALGIAVSTRIAAHMSEPQLCAEMVAVIAICYGVAYVGVARARSGGAVRQFSLKASNSSEPSPHTVTFQQARQKRPFRSAAAAQLWYEWRLHGMVLPVISVLLVGLFYLLFLSYGLGDTLSPVPFVEPNKDGFVPTISTFVTIYYLPLLMLIPFVSWVVGCGARRNDLKRGDRTFQLFYGTRPMSDVALVNAKLKGAAVSVIVTWILVIGLTLPLIRLHGGYFNVNSQIVVYADRTKNLAQLLGPYLGTTEWLHIAAFLFLAMALTWRNYAIGFWTELSGKAWLHRGYPLALILGITVFQAFSTISSGSPHPWLTIDLIALVASGLVVVKLVTATILAAYQKLSGGLKFGTMIAGAVALSVFGIVLSEAWLYLTETYRSQMAQARVSAQLSLDVLFVAIALLAIPMVRILAAPIMLSWNRHRLN